MSGYAGMSCFYKKKIAIELTIWYYNRALILVGKKRDRDVIDDNDDKGINGASHCAKCFAEGIPIFLQEKYQCTYFLQELL